jgi:hypothetical protein
MSTNQNQEKIKKNLEKIAEAREILGIAMGDAIGATETVDYITALKQGYYFATQIVKDPKNPYIFKEYEPYLKELMTAYATTTDGSKKEQMLKRIIEQTTRFVQGMPYPTLYADIIVVYDKQYNVIQLEKNEIYNLVTTYNDMLQKYYEKYIRATSADLVKSK